MRAAKTLVHALLDEVDAWESLSRSTDFDV